MPLFDVGSERSPLVVLASPEILAFEADARTVVQEHLAALLGEKTFTVTGRIADYRPSESAGATENTAVPETALALDSSGRSVVVVVAATVDEHELSAALGAAGRASRLTRTELAGLYPEGADRFHKDVTDFYDSLPTGRPAQARGGAVRLVVVCADVTPAVRDALAFLRAVGPTVEVFRVGVLPTAPGRRMLDVSPLVVTAASSTISVTQRSSSAVPADTPSPHVVSSLGRVSVTSRRVSEGAITGPVVAVPVGRVSSPELTGPVRTSAFGTAGIMSAAAAADRTTILPPVRPADYPVYSLPPVEPVPPVEQAPFSEEWSSPSPDWAVPLQEIGMPSDEWVPPAPEASDEWLPPVPESSGSSDDWVSSSRRWSGHSPLSGPLPTVDLPPPGTPYTPIFLSVPEVLSDLPARPSGGAVLDAGPRTALNLAVAPASDSGYVAGRGEAAAWDDASGSVPSRSAYRASAFIAAKKYIPEKLDPDLQDEPSFVLDREPERAHAARVPVERARDLPARDLPARDLPARDLPARDLPQRASAVDVVDPQAFDAPNSLDDAPSLDGPSTFSFDGPSSLSFDGSSSPFWVDLSAQFSEPVRFDPPDPPELPDFSDSAPPPAEAWTDEEGVEHDGSPHGPRDDALVELASALHEALPLIWVRHRRNERFEALLHPDGTIETADGEVYADPSWAANAVSGGTASDGWRVWRAGDGGPTLLELLG
ncbi:hypothetical protein [Sanguibacter antarcticus]|uniref:RAMA domain-containing protein n=1 Tax=Sanguibacter antarcticus TaxID=372484 RepID=A0A2A9E8S8_9MICO|nr:hypothetical protein [Sanguibacter antarcticus]PFG35233.1 hypothetical protein ATL42_3175 [Sanguibacter antarcticus]